MISVAMRGTRAKPPSIGFIGAIALLACADSVVYAQPPSDPAQRITETVLGTWTGTSQCVGNRPACRNEEVVYRFRPVAKQPRRVTLLADKVIDGKRVPMYTLEFIFTEDSRTLSCEFTKGQAHGIWEYTVSGETMAGTLVILPERSLGRRVKVHRVGDEQVPKAPALDEYGPLG